MSIIDDPFIQKMSAIVFSSDEELQQEQQNTQHPEDEHAKGKHSHRRTGQKTTQDVTLLTRTATCLHIAIVGTRKRIGRKEHVASCQQSKSIQIL